jgi:hypothetical protein
MENEVKGFKGLSGNAIKIIAVVTMLIDHIGAFVLEPGIFRDQETIQMLFQTSAGMRWFWIDRVLRTIGRISFPIFCFLLVEGFIHTRNVKKYAGRLFLFALISEIPFDLGLAGTFVDLSFQNVYFTLFIGLITLMGLKHFKDNLLFQMLTIFAGCIAAVLLKTDYDMTGILMIVVLYMFRFNKKLQTALGGFMAVMESMANYGAAILAFIPIYLYNGERGKWNLKYLFYWFYPVHILILTLIRYMIFGV